MPLSLANVGGEFSILRIKGQDEARRFLTNLGLVEGEKISVVSKSKGNMILLIKNSRIALDNSMAQRIIVR